MNKLKSYFLFSREHRRGFLLFAYYFGSIRLFFLKIILFLKNNNAEDKAWLLVQNEIDSLKNIQSTKKTPFILLIQII